MERRRAEYPTETRMLAVVLAALIAAPFVCAICGMLVWSLWMIGRG